MKNKILIVEDDKDIRAGVRLILEKEGFAVEEASSGTEGLSLMKNQPDLVILDIMLPGISGIKTCKMIRRISNVPILFLTARSSDADVIEGLAAGGDEYVIKPFSYDTLVSRVKALIRRYYVYKGSEKFDALSAHVIEHSGIRVNEEYNDVTVDGREVNLSDLEYGILLLLIRNPGRIFSAEKIYESVWNEPFLYSSNSTIMVHIRKLRLKIEKNAHEPEHIKTVWGKGYRFE